MEIQGKASQEHGIEEPLGAIGDLQAVAEKVCASRTFRGSESLRRLLIFLAKRTLQSPDSPPKEYEIAVEALDRPASFDPRVDSAVRVATSRLRAKLAEYYSDEGRNDPVVIELSRGLYSLRLREPVPAGTGGGHEPAPLHVPPPPHLPRVLWPAFLCILVAVGFSSFQFGKRAAVSGAASGARWTKAMTGFWQPFLSREKPTVVVLGTPLMLRSDSGLYYRDHQWNDWNEPGAAEKRRAAEHLLGSPVIPSYRYTGIGESAAAFLIGQLVAGRGYDLAFRRSSAFAWDALRTSNVVFVGAPKWAPQIQDLPIEQEFIFDGGSVINRRPKPGEPTAFEWGALKSPSYDELLHGHALVTRVSGLPGYGGILALSSASTEGAWAAAEYVSRVEHLENLLRRLQTADGAWPSCFQVVIRAKFNALVPVTIDYVTHRVLKAAPDPVR